MNKKYADIYGKDWEVGYPLCSGCSELIVGGTCAWEGNGCRYPDSRIKKPRTYYTAYAATKTTYKFTDEEIRKKEIELYEKEQS